MSYQALYRKYRPVDFNGIVGQPVLVQTLKNAITTGHISHAYLFSGPRGTGKTTTARVFAKAINCQFAKDGEPCNECETCLGINNGTLADYVEIDAASNNGVDEIRNIRSQIKYAPLVANYKIYVIDEAHMLSLGAFNALLKTLEEPPSYAIFILATTNPQKIPATIISRLQKYNFHRLSNEDLTNQLDFILKKENIEYDKSAIDSVAQLANGGMRDALSILDQAVTLSNGKITLDLVNELTGSTTKDLLFQYLKSIHDGDVKSAVEEIDQIIHEGKDLAQFIHEFIILIKDILLLKNNINPVSFTSEELEQFKEIPAAWFYQALKVLNDEDQRLKKTVYADLLIEIMTIELSDLTSIAKTTSVQSEQPPKQVEQIPKITIKQPEKKVEFKPIEQQVEVAETKESDSSITGTFINYEGMDQVLKNATRQSLEQLNEKWEEVINEADGELAALIKYTHPVAASNDGAIISFKFLQFLQKLDQRSDLQADLQELTGNLKIMGISDEEWPEYRKNYIISLKQGKVKPEETNQEVNNEKESAVKEDHSELTSNMEAIIKFLGPENVKIIDD